MLHPIARLSAHNDPTFHDTSDPHALVRRQYTMARSDEATLAKIAQYCLANQGKTGRDYLLLELPDAGDGLRTLELVAADELFYRGEPITQAIAPGHRIELKDGRLARVLIVNDETEEAVHDGDILATGASGGLLLGTGLAAAAAGGVVPGLLMAAKGLEAMAGAGDAAHAKKVDQRPWLPTEPRTTAGDIAARVDSMMRVSPEFEDRVEHAGADTLSLVGDYLVGLGRARPAEVARTVRGLPLDHDVAGEDLVCRLGAARDLMIDLARDWRTHAKIRPAIRELVFQADAEALVETVRDSDFPPEVVAAVEKLSPADKRALCWNLVYSRADIRDAFNNYNRLLPPPYALGGDLAELAQTLTEDAKPGPGLFFVDLLDLGNAVISAVGLKDYRSPHFADRLHIARNDKVSQKVKALIAEHGLVNAE